MDRDREGTAGPRTLVMRAGAAAAVLLLAAACSSSSTSSTPSASPTTQAAAPAAPTTPAAAPASCSSGTPSVSGSGPADPAGSAAKISANYTAFFNPATPAQTKLGLLENGAKFAPVLQMFGSDPQAAQTAVYVTKVNFTSATSADVGYVLCIGGTVALPTGQGKSVLSNGTWQVGDATLCGLLALKSSSPIPGCS